MLNKQPKQLLSTAAQQVASTYTHWYTVVVVVAGQQNLSVLSYDTRIIFIHQGHDIVVVILKLLL
jgi:hypothetical protein